MRSAKYRLHVFLSMLIMYIPMAKNCTLLPPAYVARWEGNVLTLVSPSIHLSVHRGPQPGPDGGGGVGGGGTPARSRRGRYPGQVQMGGYPSQVQMGVGGWGVGVPRPGPDGGGTPARSRWGGTPARSRWGGYPSQVQMGVYPRVLPSQGWGAPLPIWSLDLGRGTPPPS